uniref:Uncharacterized protein n=1 Tax=Strigamia maritima TaxID=126957 RepID=T1ILP8_STRMM
MAQFFFFMQIESIKFYNSFIIDVATEYRVCGRSRSRKDANVLILPSGNDEMNNLLQLVVRRSAICWHCKIFLINKTLLRIISGNNNEMIKTRTHNDDVEDLRT